jgi:hypothetical protein
VASENGQTGEPGDGMHEPRECMPCRGSGRVISNLGGTQRTLECPWCRGRGERLAGIDAQEHWAEDDRRRAVAADQAVEDTAAAPSADDAPDAPA